MPTTYQRFFLALIIYLSVCVCTLIFITPYSFSSFVGPAAGITTALAVLWGASILFAIIVSTLLFCLVLSFGVGLVVEPSMVIITLLALLLQGLGAHHLTQNEVNKQNWLKSRRGLLFFLLKVGPLISLISAFSVIILTLLESQELSNNLFFTFINCWSKSVLFSVFFSPLLLLTQGRQQLSLTKRMFIILSSVLALVTLGVLFHLSQNFQQYQRIDKFEQVKNRVVQAIQQESALDVAKINSLSAFVKSIKIIDKEEFNLYAKQIFDKNSSVRALEWAPIITHEMRAEFEQKYGSINEKNKNGMLQKASVRTHYAPINFVYPLYNNEKVFGLDVLTNSKKSIDMENVITYKKVVTSAPISLIQDEQTNLGVLFVSPVFSEYNKKEDLLGFVVAVVQFKQFFQQLSPLDSDDIALFIEDISSSEPYTLFGKTLNTNYRHVETTYIDVNSRKWRISLGENHPWQMQDKNWQVWAMLLGSTFGGMLFQTLILMMAVYSNELSAQVTRKTKELILAKEESDHKSTAKTNFLYTLTSELHTPLQAIAHFTKQLKKADKKEQTHLINNIELAHRNTQKLLNMVVDLSQIELGKLTVIKEPIDFYGFIERIDEMVKANSSDVNGTITFLINPNVPNFINSDELRIQQLLIAFCDGIHQLFGIPNIRLSIKVHAHTINTATMLFVFTSNIIEEAANPPLASSFVAKDITLFSAEMAMAKEVCQLMGGDASLAVSASGEKILTATIKIEITSNEQQRVFQTQFFESKIKKSN